MNCEYLKLICRYSNARTSLKRKHAINGCKRDDEAILVLYSQQNMIEWFGGIYSIPAVNNFLSGDVLINFFSKFLEEALY